MIPYAYNILFLKFLLIFILIAIFVLLKYYNKQAPRQLFRYKIKYFYLNWVLILSYIVGYFGFLLILRIQYLSQISDLKLIYHTIYKLYINKSLFDFIYLTLFFLVLCALIIYIFYLLHNMFITEIIKRFLTVRYLTDHLKLESYTLRAVSYKWDDVILTLLAYIRKKNNLKDTNFLWQIYTYGMYFVFMQLPTITLVCIFAYEMIYNDYILSSYFYYYLLFYFFYSIYKRISNYIIHSNYFITTMVYEMYYKEGSVMYANIPDEWEDIVYNFVDNGLYRNSLVNHIPILDDYIPSPFEIDIMTYYKWISKDGRMYYNNAYMEIDEKTNIRYDTPMHEYLWLRKIYKKIKIILYGQGIKV